MHTEFENAKSKVNISILAFNIHCEGLLEISFFSFNNNSFEMMTVMRGFASATL